MAAVILSYFSSSPSSQQLSKADLQGSKVSFKATIANGSKAMAVTRYWDDDETATRGNLLLSWQAMVTAFLHTMNGNKKSSFPALISHLLTPKRRRPPLLHFSALSALISLPNTNLTMHHTPKTSLVGSRMAISKLRQAFAASRQGSKVAAVTQLRLSPNLKSAEQQHSQATKLRRLSLVAPRTTVITATTSWPSSRTFLWCLHGEGGSRTSALQGSLSEEDKARQGCSWAELFSFRSVCVYSGKAASREL